MTTHARKMSQAVRELRDKYGLPDDVSIATGQRVPQPVEKPNPLLLMKFAFEAAEKSTQNPEWKRTYRAMADDVLAMMAEEKRRRQ